MPSNKTINIDAAERMLDEGMTLGNVADALNMNIGTLSNRLKCAGVVADRYHKGYITTWAGYRKLYTPNHYRADKKGYVHEHILVMEEQLDRYLEKDETVHHINYIKDDNRPANLELMDIYQHKSIHSSQTRKGLEPGIARQMLDSGTTMPDVAAHFGMCESGLRKALQRTGYYKTLERGYTRHKNKI